MEKSLEKVLSVLLSKGMIISATYIVAAFILVVVLNHLSKKYREKIDPADIRLNAFVRSVSIPSRESLLSSACLRCCRPTISTSRP